MQKEERLLSLPLDLSRLFFTFYLMRFFFWNSSSFCS